MSVVYFIPKELLDLARKFSSYDIKDLGKILALIDLSYTKYYAKRNKYNAALQYSSQAIRSFSILEDWQYVAECHLHRSYILWKLDRHHQTMKELHLVIDMVTQNKLDISSNQGRKILVLALHNMAAQQCNMGQIGNACISIENTTKLVQLCMNSGDSIVPKIESTQRACLTKLMDIILCPKHDQ